MAEAALFVEIVPTTSGVKRSIEKDLGGAFQETEKKGSGVLNKLGGLAKGVGLAAAGAVAAFTGIAVAGGFARAMKIDEAQAKLRGLGNDTAAVETIMGNALASVQGTSFSLDAAATTAAGAVAAGIAPGQELERVLTSVANAAAAAGVDMSEMGSIYNKVASLGKAQNDVLQQVADRGIPIYQALADQLGVTADEVFKMASAGEIGFSQFEAAMSAAAGTVAAEMGTTFSGQWANMMASVSRIGEGLISGLFPQMKDGVAGVTDVFKQWEVGAKDVGSAVGEFVSVYGPKLVDALVDIFNAGMAVVGWVQDNATWLGPLAVGIATIIGSIYAWNAATKAWKALQATATALQSVYIAATYGQAGANYAVAGSSKVAATAQKILNAAMKANPIMLIVSAIAALVAGLVWFFTETELGQEIWANFTRFLGEAWENTTRWLTEAWENTTRFLTEAWQNVASFFETVWLSYLKPVFDAIGAVFTWIYENIILPVVTGIMIYIGLWAALVQWLYETVIVPVFGFIGEVFTWLYDNVIVPIVDGIIAYFQMWGEIFTWLNENIIQPVFAAIGEVFTWIYENVIVPIIEGIILYFQLWGEIFTWLYESIIQPVFAAIGAAFVWIYENIIAPVGAAIGAAIQTVGDTIHAVFSGVADFIGAAFQAVLGVVRGPINALIGLINTVIDGLNSISVDIPDWVPMVGGQTFGLSIPKIPQLEDGALVKARTGGIIANIGEGRYDEVVLPLSPEVLSQVGGGGGGNIIVNPQPGQSEEEIGRAAARYQAQAARRFG